MTFTSDTPLYQVLASLKGRALLVKHLPELLAGSELLRNPGRTLAELAPLDRRRTLPALLDDLNRSVADGWLEDGERLSMDELDRRAFAPRFTPWDAQAETVELSVESVAHPAGAPRISLDGEWQLAEGGKLAERLSGAWDDAIPARVPGSVHSALVEAGRIPDPSFGRNQIIARQESFKTWWLRREFARPADMEGETLMFGGVANRCTVWLNGQMLGGHEGMFGGPDFDIADRLEEQNCLVVRLDPVPFEIDKNRSFNPDSNDSWKRTVVFNNVYGWHYSNLPSLGIWRSVAIHDRPTVALVDPFIRTIDAAAGIAELALRFQGPAAGWSGALHATIAPDNFAGQELSFSKTIRSQAAARALNLRFQIPDPRVWWPVDMGDQPLYQVTLSFSPDAPGAADVQRFTFGLRTIEMAPLPGGPQPELYNWTFVVNGQPMFIKGTNWCTLDALLDFSRERYERFIQLAAQQHVQMFRPWGSGMPETDDFYDLCDRYGILVMQEWPTAWNSHVTQPYDMLEETVRRNTLRIRNHPSLAMYGAGNESGAPFGPAIDMMGRLSIELDDTRPFHRAEPWGGSTHDYGTYWGRQNLDHSLNMTSVFWGEFGLACSPVYESVTRYLPDEEKDVWPPLADGAFAYHSPIFDTYDDVSRLKQNAYYFVSRDCTLEQYTVGSQLSQAVGIRHTLELARCRWPHSTGALYYKMTDNFPAASWACIDWYGAPKIGHYFFQDAFAPLHAAVLFTSVNNVGLPLALPVFLLDDADALVDSSWQVVLRAYSGDLHLIKRSEHDGHGSVTSPHKLGDFTLAFDETDTVPLFVVSEVWREGALAQRTFYFVNYEPVKGSLFTLPKTTLEFEAQGKTVVVSNTGDLPAVAVDVSRPGRLHTFSVSDNYFWLDAGASATVEVSDTDGLAVSAWNAG
ncbi:MAG: beta-mannosidase [Chloroflexi bacterium]|nr:beta-mannosidase [Chloroflexota bacterium]